MIVENTSFDEFSEERRKEEELIGKITPTKKKKVVKFDVVIHREFEEPKMEPEKEHILKNKMDKQEEEEEEAQNRAAVKTTTAEETTDNKTILDKLGGDDGLTIIVEEFYKRFVADKELGKFFDGIIVEELKLHQEMFMRMAFTTIPHHVDVGKFMLLTHEDLFLMGLNGSHFDLVVNHFVETLQSLDIEDTITDAAVSVIAPLRVAFVKGSIEMTSAQAEDLVSNALRLAEETALAEYPQEDAFLSKTQVEMNENPVEGNATTGSSKEGAVTTETMIRAEQAEELVSNALRLAEEKALAEYPQNDAFIAEAKVDTTNKRGICAAAETIDVAPVDVIKDQADTDVGKLDKIESVLAKSSTPRDEENANNVWILSERIVFALLISLGFLCLSGIFVFPDTFSGMNANVNLFSMLPLQHLEQQEVIVEEKRFRFGRRKPKNNANKGQTSKQKPGQENNGKQRKKNPFLSFFRLSRKGVH